MDGRLGREVALFSRVAEAVASTLEIDRILDVVVEEVGGLLGADAASVYLLDPARDLFVLRATRGLDPAAVGVTTIAWNEGIAGWAAARGETASAADAPADPRYAYKPETREERYRGLLAAPLRLDDRVEGILILQTRAPRAFEPREAALVEAVAHQIGHALRNARLYEEAAARLAEMRAVHDVVRSIGRSLDLREVLDEVVSTAARTLAARGCILRLRRRGGDVLEIVAHTGLPDGFDPARAARAPGEGISGCVAVEGTAVRLEDVRADPRFKGEEMGIFHSILCVPMWHGGKVIGTIGVFDKTIDGRPGAFTEADERLLAILAQQAATGCVHAEVYDEARGLAGTLGRRVRELEILHTLSRTLQGTIEVDEILFLVLTAITSGQGLGFNRALILLTDPETRRLNGAMGIGPTVEEVDRVWKTAAEHLRTLEDYFDSTDRRTIENSPFNRLVRTISLPLAAEGGPPLPGRAVVEARPFRVDDALRAPDVDRAFVEKIRTRAFAAVPVFAKEIVIGCVVVDNCFNLRPISDEDLRLLQTLANQAGLAIEAARLVGELNGALERLERIHRLLAEAEKMAAIGEVATGVAHDIRNPVTVIGGFARRLARRIGDGPDRTYVEIILREAARLEALAADVLLYARGGRREAVETDLADLAAEVARARAPFFDERGVALFVEPEAAPPALVDREAFTHALLNIVQNAAEATPRGGRVTISVAPDDGGVRLEVRDTGAGIPPEALGKVFEPFFTTKTKGTGLGLALARKIVEAHKGRIEAESRPGEGSVFRVRLPAAPGGG